MAYVSRFVSRVLVALVRAYQAVLSPLMGGACRFEPSCSRYAIGAIEAHGPAKGLALTAMRLLRCRPFGPHGYDPVPPKGRWRNDFATKGVHA